MIKERGVRRPRVLVVHNCWIRDEANAIPIDDLVDSAALVTAVQTGAQATATVDGER
jgi:hypothetical protein